MQKKKFSEWEKDKGMFLTSPSKSDLDRDLTESEFNDLVQQSFQSFTGVNYSDRVNFLKSNGYKLTRENLVNGNLSSKPS